MKVSKNQAKIRPKSQQNRTKIAPKWLQKWSKIGAGEPLGPQCLPGPPTGRCLFSWGAIFERKRAPQSGQGAPREAQGPAPGTPKILPEGVITSILASTKAFERQFKANFVKILILTIFWHDFKKKCVKKQREIKQHLVKKSLADQGPRQSTDVENLS